MGIDSSTLKPEAEQAARVVIPALRAAAPPAKAEVFSMRVKMLEWDSAKDGTWGVSRGYVPSQKEVTKQLPVRVATYNTWFDRSEGCTARWTALFDLLFTRQLSAELLDIVALQEVIKPSWELLKTVEAVKRDWIIVDCDSVLQTSACWYGTTMLVRRKWMADHGLDKVEASLTLYESPMARSFLCVEISSAEGIALRMGTSHFESGPTDFEHRRRQFYTAARLTSFPSSYTVVEQAPKGFPKTVDAFIDSLASGVPISVTSIPPAVIVGDTNIESYDELNPLLSEPLSFIDTFDSLYPLPLAPRSEQETLKDRYSSHATFFTTFPLVEGAKHLSQKRIDYVLVRKGGAQVHVKEANLVGDIPIAGLRDPRGKDGNLFPSDHLGVVVQLEFELV